MLWVRNLHPERASYGSVDITFKRHLPHSWFFFHLTNLTIVACTPTRMVMMSCLKVVGQFTFIMSMDNGGSAAVWY